MFTDLWLLNCQYFDAILIDKQWTGVHTKLTMPPVLWVKNKRIGNNDQKHSTKKTWHTQTTTTKKNI